MPVFTLRPLLALLAVVLVVAMQAVLIVWLRRRERAHARAVRRLEERLRFEMLVSQLSAGLIHVPAADLDVALERSLGEVVGMLGGDRGRLDEYDDTRPGLSWVGPGVEALPRIRDEQRFPWTVAQLNDNRVVRFTRTDELPETAGTDRASYGREGTRSHLALPLRREAQTLGVLAVDAVHAEHAWSDEIVARLQALGDAFVDALERRRLDVALAERLAFEQALSSLSTTFGSVAAGDFDREVQRAIRRIVDVVNIDRATLVELLRGGVAGRTWTTDRGARADACPWMLEKVRHGEVVALTRIDELPEEAEADRRSWRAHGIASQAALPLLMRGGIVGALVVSTVRRERAWERDGLLRALQLVAEVFASALSRQQADHEMQRLRQELAHIGRVSAMGELTASLAHELNQPLTAILNNAQVAQRFLDADALDIDELREILSDIVADDKRAADVIRRLRLLLKKGDLEYASLDLNEVVTEVARLVMNDAAIRNVAIRLDLAQALPRVRGDRVQLQQVLLNLVLNGLDAMRDAAVGDRDLVIRTFGDGAAAAGVAVQDAGPGIVEQHAARIFEPLYTTKADGIGMGLAITRTIVDAHGGHVRADNNADGGATFQFTLPADQVAP